MTDDGDALQCLYVIMRLNRWAVYVRWLDNRGGGRDPTPPRARSWWFKLVMMTRVQQTTVPGRSLCPVDAGEAIETQRCIKALPEHLRMTVVEDHLVRGAPEEKAHALGIDCRTFRQRRRVAYRELLGLFSDVAAGIDIEARAAAEESRPRRGRPPIAIVAIA